MDWYKTRLYILQSEIYFVCCHINKKFSWIQTRKSWTQHLAHRNMKFISDAVLMLFYLLNCWSMYKISLVMSLVFCLQSIKHFRNVVQDFLEKFHTVRHNLLFLNIIMLYLVWIKVPEQRKFAQHCGCKIFCQPLEINSFFFLGFNNTSNSSTVQRITHLNRDKIYVTFLGYM